MNPSAVRAELDTKQNGDVRQIMEQKEDGRVGGIVGLQWTQEERAGPIGHIHLGKVTGKVVTLSLATHTRNSSHIDTPDD